MGAQNGTKMNEFNRLNIFFLRSIAPSLEVLSSSTVEQFEASYFKC